MNVDRNVFSKCVASLAAAISLLERGGKRAAPSDKMFLVMLSDYKRALEEASDAFRHAAVAEAIQPQRCKCLKPECVECHPAN